MYHVSAQGVDEHMINVHYYYYSFAKSSIVQLQPGCDFSEQLHSLDNHCV